MNELLEQAKNALKQGQKAEARRLLVQVIRQDQRNETAWLWMSGAVETLEERRRCLEQVLEINPDNELAHRGLDRLTGAAPSTPVQPSAPKAPVFASGDGVIRTAKRGMRPVEDDEEEPEPESAGDGSARGRGRGCILFFFVVVLLSVVLVLALVLTPLSDYLAQIIPFLPVPSPQPTAALPGGPTPTTAVVPTWTPTPTPITMPAATATLKPTQEGAGYTPGDPTATPPGEDITDANYLEGKSAYEAGDYEQVLALMALVLEANPDLAPPYWYRGMAYYHLGEYDSGIDEMAQAVVLDSEYALAYADLGLLQAAVGNVNGALFNWERAVELDPSLAKVYRYRGELYEDQGDDALALEAYSLALEINPADSDLFRRRGDLLVRLTRFQECIDTSTQTIERDDAFWAAYFVRGTCWLLFGRDQSARDDFLVYVDAVPDDYLGWLNLGQAYDGLGDANLALQNYDQAIELNSTDVSARYQRARVLVGLEAYVLAVADLDIVLSEGEYLDSRDLRGAAHFYLGNYDLAIADLELAVEQDPDRVSTYALLARAYLAQGVYQETVDVATKGIAIELSDPNTPVCYQARGRAYLELADYDRAIEDLTIALVYKPTPDAYYYRGRAYQGAGQVEEAIRDYENAVLTHVPGDGFDALAQDAQVRLNQLQ